MAKEVQRFEVRMGGVALRYSKRSLQKYIQEAVSSWCKQYDPTEDDFDIGDDVKVVCIPNNPNA